MNETRQSARAKPETRPRRWYSLIVVAVVLGYSFLETKLERFLGISLPGFRSASENSADEAPSGDPAAGATSDRGRQREASGDTVAHDAARSSSSAGSLSGSDGNAAYDSGLPGGGTASVETSRTAATHDDRSPRRAEVGTTQARAPPAGSGSAGGLRQLSNGDLVSSAGLIYGRGGREGTRLAHVLRHAEDQPNRPGSHGVFDGGVDTIVAVIDEAFRKGLQGGSGSRVTREGDRTVYTVDLGRRVGYVGGSTGKRSGYPPAHHVRLVVAGKRVITAYPLRRR